MLDTMVVVANVVALVGWLALFLAPAAPNRLVATARIVGGLLAVAYLALFLSSLGPLSAFARNYTLDGVGTFFARPELSLLGWVHYLAFDLWVGAWEVEEGRRAQLPHGVLLVTLLLTYAIGPVGLLSFLAARAVWARNDPRTGSHASTGSA